MAESAVLLSGPQTASGTQLLGESATPATPEVSLVIAAVFTLNISAATAPTSLDVYVQHSTDDGTTWDDFIHFTQVTAGTAANYRASWVRDILPTVPTGPFKDATLTAATVNQGPTGDKWRLKWVIVGTSFTFEVSGRYIHDER